MKKKITLMLFIPVIAFIIYSCTLDKNATPVMADFNAPDNAVLTVRDIRAKGATLDWTDISGKGYEYAIAASYDGKIEDYRTALENGKVVLDFTPAEMLNGTYKIATLIPGKNYEIKLFVRAENIEATEYLKSSANLPYIDDAEIYSIKINGEEAMYEKSTDRFTYYYLQGTEDEAESYSFTYSIMRGCALYIDGVKVEDKEIPLTAHEVLEVTVVHEATQAARDYSIYVGSRKNGLPIVIINTENSRKIRDKTTDISASIKIIDSVYNPLGVGLYEGEIEIRGRGNSSFGMPKKGYNFSIAQETQILDMAPSKDWMLAANYSDKSLMRNYTAYEFSRDLGAAFSPKMRYVDLILNGNYLGNYMIGERVKVDEGRLDFPKITADTTDEYELTGTYVLEVNSADKWNQTEVIFETSKINLKKQHFWSIRQPGSSNITPAAYEYIKNYVNAAEDALFGDNFKDPENGYRAYIDTASVIDWYLVNELYKQVDANFHTSTFFYKPRGAKLHMGPVWDFDLGGGNADYSGCDNPEGWYVRGAAWITRMFEDEAFVKEFKDRWNYVKNNGYFDVFFQRIDETAEYIKKSAEMNFQRWQILGIYVWPNAGNVWERTTYQSEVDFFKEWITLRIEWMDKEINK